MRDQLASVETPGNKGDGQGSEARAYSQRVDHMGGSTFVLDRKEQATEYADHDVG